jgi:hypothetical protein
MSEDKERDAIKLQYQEGKGEVMDPRRELVAVMRRLLLFAENRQLYGVDTLEEMKAFVDGATFITNDSFEPHPVVTFLEKAAEVEKRVNDMLNRALKGKQEDNQSLKGNCEGNSWIN